MGSVVPIPGAAKGMKDVGKWVTKIISNTPDLAKKMPTRFHIRALEETAMLRRNFRHTRKEFIKEYAGTIEASNVELEIMKNGKLPDG